MAAKSSESSPVTANKPLNATAMHPTTTSAFESWPVKPGLKVIPESRLDNRSDEEIVSSLQEYRPVTSEKNVWAFWHSGFANSPRWVQRTVINWVRRLPTWSVHVLDSIPGSPLHFHRYIPPALLPDALNNKTMTGPYVGPHSADLIRLPLIYLHGGVWMDCGTLLFRDLDDICWSRLEDPESPYELAGFTFQLGGGKGRTWMNSFIAARKGNPFVKRWHHIFLEVWKGVSESKGMHAHPLFKCLPLPGETQDPQIQNHKIEPHSKGAESQPQLNQCESKPPWSDESGMETLKDLADYGAQFSCFKRLSLLEDPSDGFNGSEYLDAHALLFDAMQELLLAQQLTGWDGVQQFQHLATKILPDQEGIRDPRYVEAEKFAESLVRDSCQMKISHGIKSVPCVMLGVVWERPGNEDADWAEGTFAAYLRYASVFLEQTRVMRPEKMGHPNGKILRLGVLEVGDEVL